MSTSSSRKPASGPGHPPAPRRTNSVGKERGAGSRTAPESRPTRRKARGLLSAYYGLQEAAGEAKAKTEKRQNPLDIDSPAFESDRYVSKFLQEADVVQLIQKDNDLITAVKTLDGEMKTLVYENYSKFITATDTIRKMKDTVDSMEAEMDGLLAQVEKINTKSAVLNEALGERRQKVRQLNGVHSVLQKLQFIFDLPTRLQESLVNNQLPQAVRYYARTSKIFDQYRDLSVFKSIEVECRGIMKDVTSTLEAQLKRASSAASIVEATELLLGLGKPVKEMSKAMIEASVKHLGQVKTSCVKILSGDKERAKKLDRTASSASGTGGDTGAEPNSPTSPTSSSSGLPVDLINERYLADLAALVGGYEELFLLPGQSKPPAGVTTTTSPTEAIPPGAVAAAASGSALPSAGQRLRADRFLPSMTTEERVEALESLKTALSAPVHDYFTMVSDSIENPSDIFQLDAAQLSLVFSSILRAAKAYPALCRLGELDDEARRFTMGRVRRTVGALLSQSSAEVLDRFKPLWTMDRTVPPELAKFVGETVNWLSFLLGTKVLAVVASFLSNDAGNFVNLISDGRTEFVEIVRVELRLFWLDLLQGMMHYSSPHYFRGEGPRHPGIRHDEVPPPTVTLAMCRFAADLPVRLTYEAFAVKLWGRKRDAGQPDAWTKVRRVVTDGSAGDEVMLDAKDVADSVEQMSGELAALYVANAAEVLTTPLDGYLGWLSDWVSPRGPIDRISETITTLLHNVTRYDKEVSDLFPDAKAGAGPSTPSAIALANKSSAASLATPYGLGTRENSSLGLAGAAAAAGTRGAGGARNIRADRNLMVNIDKLFADKEEWYSKSLKRSRLALLGGISKLVFKAWVELARVQTFGKDGFQQLQADVEVSRVALWKYAIDHRAFNSLVDEIVASAAIRVNAPVEFIDKIRLDKLIAQHEASLGVTVSPKR